MTDPPSGKNMACALVRCFQSWGIGPGETLRAANFVAIAKKCDLTTDVIGGGMRWGLERGWFEVTGTQTIRLTDAAFMGTAVKPPN